jgi:RNA polymerase sigma-70 factor (ECF subfamily)
MQRQTPARVVSQMAHSLKPEPDSAGPSAAAPAKVAVGSGEQTAQVGTDTRRDVLRSYEEHKGELFAFLVSVTRDGELAADLLQESFMRLLREGARGGAPLDPRAWLFRVAGNLAVSAARRRLTVSRWAPWLVRRESEASPEQEYLRREDADLVHAALASLRTDDRVGLLMAAHGYPTPEIADALGRTELATRSLLCRARIKLRDQVERQETNR